MGLKYNKIIRLIILVSISSLFVLYILTFDWHKGKYILSQVGLAYIISWLVFGLLSYIFIKIKLFRK